MDLETESLTLVELGLQLAYSGTLTLRTVLEKKLFRFCTELKVH